jgi:arginine decarboxylase
VLVINPTYFGISGDLKRIVEIAHSLSIPVLVEEAHGAHIHFHDQLPLSAMQAGADMAATKLGISGFDAERWLRERFNIEVELSDLYNILCIITPGDTEEDLQKLVFALEELSKVHKNQADENIAASVQLPKIPVLAVTPREVFYAETEVVPFEESAGRIIAEFVMVYPPGIPIFIPGEVISEDNLIYTRKNIAAGLPVQGAEDCELHLLRVLKVQHR